MRRSWHCTLLAIVTLASLSISTACARRPTQLLVVVDSDLPVEERACVAARVSSWDSSQGLGATEQSLFFFDGRAPSGPRLPFSFAVLKPRNGVSRVQLEVVALRATDCDALTPNFANARVRRIVRTGFVEEQTLRLPIFLAAACIPAACVSGEDCNGGTCQPIPEVTGLSPVVPGREFESPDDAASIDVGVDGFAADAGNDAHLFAATRPGATRSVVQEEALDGHGVITPVGVAGPNHVIVAGVTQRGVDFNGIRVEVPDAGMLDGGVGYPQFFLAAVSPTEAPLWTTSMEAEGYPYPVVRRVLPIPSGGYILCGTAGAPFRPAGVRLAGSANAWVFVARLTRMGEFELSTLHRIDALQTMGTFSPELWCQDLALDGDSALITARVSNADRVRLDSIETALGEVAEQDLLLIEVRNVSTTFDIQPAVIVGRARITPAQQVLHLDGVPFFARVSGDGAHIFAAEADALEPLGALPGPPGSASVHVVRMTGATEDWHLNPIATFGDARMKAHLRALEVSRAWIWLAVVVQLDGAAASTVTFGSLPPIDVTMNATYLVRIQPTTGEIAGATLLPPGSDHAFEDNAGGSTRADQLYGGALTVTADEHALFATNATEGDRVGETTLSVFASPDTAQTDPLLGIIDTTGAPVAIWQWTGSNVLRDWRLTHVEWLESDYVAVAGYVESTGPDSALDRVWRREASLFEFYRAR